MLRMVPARVWESHSSPQLSLPALARVVRMSRDGPPQRSRGPSIPTWCEAAYQPARFVLVDAPQGADVVGLLALVFTQDTNFSGGLFDDSYAAWHGDGTEIMNSGIHSPAYGNFCMGVWTKSGPSTYTLKHIALDYSMQPVGSTTPSVIVIIREKGHRGSHGKSFHRLVYRRYLRRKLLWHLASHARSPYCASGRGHNHRRPHYGGLKRANSF